MKRVVLSVVAGKRYVVMAGMLCWYHLYCLLRCAPLDVAVAVAVGVGMGVGMGMGMADKQTVTTLGECSEGVE